MSCSQHQLSTLSSGGKSIIFATLRQTSHLLCSSFPTLPGTIAKCELFLSNHYYRNIISDRRKTKRFTKDPQIATVTIAAMFQQKANQQAFLTASKNQDYRFLLPGYGRKLDFYPVEKNVYGQECRSMYPTALDDRDIEHGYTEYVCDS